MATVLTWLQYTHSNDSSASDGSLALPRLGTRSTRSYSVGAPQSRLGKHSPLAEQMLVNGIQKKLNAEELAYVIRLKERNDALALRCEELVSDKKLVSIPHIISNRSFILLLSSEVAALKATIVNNKVAPTPAPNQDILPNTIPHWSSVRQEDFPYVRYWDKETYNQEIEAFKQRAKSVGLDKPEDAGWKKYSYLEHMDGTPYNETAIKQLRRRVRESLHTMETAGGAGIPESWGKINSAQSKEFLDDICGRNGYQELALGNHGWKAMQIGKGVFPDWHRNRPSRTEG